MFILNAADDKIVKLQGKSKFSKAINVSLHSWRLDFGPNAFKNIGPMHNNAPFDRRFGI